MVLQLLSEPYSPSGSMVGTTMERAVRNTELDEWSILLRETLQNSFDARLPGARSITYRVSLERAEEEQQSTLRNDIFAETPKELSRLRRCLDDKGLPLLIIADWETRGLCGPTRADIEAEERTDFQDFFLNVGREHNKTFQGGTFGLGRGVLFEISEAGAIVVFTRTTSHERPVTRLMAMAIGRSYSKNKKKFTGRHWWGASSSSQWPEPLTGDTAVLLARKLGLDVFPNDTTGTAILVIAPKMPDAAEDEAGASLTEALDGMIEAARLYAWPLMIGRDGEPEVRFEFVHEGKAWEPLAPDYDDGPLRDFVEAYRLAQSQKHIDGLTSWHDTDITFGAGQARPKRLGRLVFRHVPPLATRLADAEESGLPSASIALMREPRMVVRYMPVASHPMGSDTRGVFVLDAAFDQAFAESEPVAHDDWIPAKIASFKSQRNPVRQALEKIRKAVKASFSAAKSGTSGDLAADDVAPVIADLLGGMISEVPGPGGTPPKPPPQGGNGSGKASVSVVSVLSPHLRVDSSGAIQALFPVKVRLASKQTGTLHGEARVVLDSGLESTNEPPEDAERPVLVGWESLDGTLLSREDELQLPQGVKDVVAVVQQPRDMAVTVTVTLSEVPHD